MITLVEGPRRQPKQLKSPNRATMAAPVSEKPLQGHIALVTGATGGIGKATCRLLAGLGCCIAIHFNKDKSSADNLKRELAKYAENQIGLGTCVVQADMGDYDSVCETWRSATSLRYTLLCQIIHLAKIKTGTTLELTNSGPKTS